MKKKILSFFITIAVLAAIAAALFFTMKKGMFNFFKGSELKIDKTPTVIAEITKISEFTSACFYEEIILQEKKSRLLLTDEIVIIANGKVRAGFNLKKLTENDVLVSGDTLTVNLPEAEIFDVIVNPSDFDIYIEDGKWDEQTVTALKNKAITQIKEDAIKDGILEKANKSGVKKLSEMFKAFGFPVVNITVNGQEVDTEEAN